MKKFTDIFISYSHKDSDFALEVKNTLNEAGLSCFMAETDIQAGDLWEQRIRKAIVNAKRVILIITPYSKSSLWIAAEAGAAWVLEKELIAGLRYVEPSELIEVIRKHQVRRLETKKDIEVLVREIVPSTQPHTSTITGTWIDPVDGDTAYFRQIDNRVLGFYDYGRGRKTGIYKGILSNSVFEYSWKWLEESINGEGRMTLSVDKRNLYGKWWYAGKPETTEKVQYRHTSDDMPEWLERKDFRPYEGFLDKGI